MITFFRKVRQHLLIENKFTKYLIYAIGEIILVVIGILIALQINNTNEIKKQRTKEIQFLKNLRADLILEDSELDRYIEIRKSMVNSAQIILEHFNGKPVENIQLFNYHNFNVEIWQAFQRINNTFLELVNSGNLTLISNDSIKNGLLNLDLIYKKILTDRDHLQHDYEQYLYRPFFEYVDLSPLAQSYGYYAANGAFNKDLELSREELDGLLKNNIFKNGFVLSIFTNSIILGDYQKMKDLNQKLMLLIDKEITKG
ncbi:DUF6090 family protein [Gaetbulibacter sp. M240]|uniref:DUF6090 family protein n=1 Tax=Gaetbulibacter sp. M240 TaxID=3126511 RepID=UPI00374E5BBB